MRFTRTYALDFAAEASVILAGSRDADLGDKAGDREKTTLRIGFKAPVESSGGEIVERDQVDIDSFRQATESVRKDMDEYAELLELAEASRSGESE